MRKLLFALVLLFSTQYAHAQTYTINSCSYATIAGSGPALPSGDDQISGMVPIGFTFNFYGTNYSQLAVCTNGWLTFNTGMPATYPGQTMPYAPIPTIIAFSWDDMYTVGGTFNYFTTGTAPNRVFVVNYNNIGYCCSSSNMATLQVQLYETTNEIRIVSANNIHAGRTASMGIQNAAIGATVVPGRNAQSWTAPANECVSFMPCTPPTVTISQNPVNAPCGGPVTLTANISTVGAFDQDQPSNNACMATASQADLAQSFIPSVSSICGAGLFLTSNAAGSGTVTIQLYDNLPNAGGVLMATGTVVASDNSWADVSWAATTVIPGNTYYLVFTSTNTSHCFAGSTSNPYASGMTYANAGYGPFPSFDYTFHTMTCAPASSYLWSTGATTQSINVTTSGTYSVVAVVGGCPGSASIVVNVPQNPTVMITQNPLVVPCGGPVNLTVALPSYDQDQPANNTCMANISQTDLAQSFIPSVNTICGAGVFLTANGSGSGTITIQLYDNLPNAGGVLLAQGSVVATDGNWADVTWASTPVTIGNTYYLVFTGTNGSHCIAGSTANPYPSGMVFANSGFGSFPSFDYTFHTTNCNPVATYLWSTGATTDNINVTTSGTYSVTVTVGACSGTASASVVVPVAPTTTGTQTDVSCFGGNNGSASVSVSGGTAPFTYAWTSGGTGSTESNLAAGSYTCTITDAAGCTATHTVTIAEPSAALTASTMQTNVACNGGSTGDAMVMATGGTPGYTYSWSSGGTGAMESGLAAGTYTCTITDANGCTDVQTVTITEPSAISVTETHTNVTCFGGTDGSIDLTVSGGVAPYTFDWNSGTYTTEDLSGIPAGTYTGTLTDANGCTSAGTITITEPSALVVTYSEPNDTVCGGTLPSPAFALTGESPAGGTWSGPGVTGNMFDPATANTGYNVITYTYTDTNGCTASTMDSIWVDLCLDVNALATSDVTIYPNPSNGIFNVIAAANTVITVYDALGNTVMSVRVINSKTEINLSGFANGVYMMKVQQDETTSTHKLILNK